MDCAQTRLYIHGSLDHELDAVTDLNLHEHLRTCEACADYYAHHRALRDRLRSALAGEATPDDVVRAVRRHLQSSIQGRGHRLWRTTLLTTIAASVAAIGMIVGVLLGTHPWGTSGPDIGNEKFVYQISTADVVAVALQNIAFHLAATPKAHIVVVTHNEGVDFLLKGATDKGGKSFEPRVAALVAKGVEFRVCHNTLNVRRIPTSRVIPEAGLVPSGIAEVGRLESQEGYSYIKP